MVVSAVPVVVSVDPVVGTADREVMSAVEMEGWRG